MVKIVDQWSISADELSLFSSLNGAEPLSRDESAFILAHASCVKGVKEKGALKAFLWLIDDEEECFVPHIMIEKGPKEAVYANICCHCLEQYREEKDFLYTQIFNYPPSIANVLTKQGYECLISAMRYNNKAVSLLLKEPVLSDLTVTTNPQEINTQGVNDIYDAVGWGGRTAQMWDKILKKSSHLVQVSHQNKVVGFARMTDNGQYGMVYDVCVSPAYQKHRIGSLLMQNIVAHIHRKKLFFTGLVVVPENISAKAFYSRFNFESASPILEYYRYNSAHQAGKDKQSSVEMKQNNNLKTFIENNRIYE